MGRPTPWGNPFPVEKGDDGTEAVRKYEEWLTTTDEGKAVTAMASVMLRGMNLMCWCRLDKPCHADVLLRVANDPEVARSSSQMFGEYLAKILSEGEEDGLPSQETL